MAAKRRLETIKGLGGEAIGGDQQATADEDAAEVYMDLVELHSLENKEM